MKKFVLLILALAGISWGGMAAELLQVDDAGKCGQSIDFTGTSVTRSGSAVATAADLAGKADTGHNHDGTYEPANANVQAHISSTSNPHSVTASQAGAVPAPAVPEQGDILYYNGSAWVALSHGTTGQYLKTQGHSANPVWETVSASGGTSANVETLSGNKSLAEGDADVQILDANGSARTVTLPMPTADDVFVVVNNSATDSSAYLQVQVTGASSYLDRIYPGNEVIFWFDSTASRWYASSGADGTNSGDPDYGYHGVSVGRCSDGYKRGAAVGYSASAGNYGAALGYAGQGSVYGAALGASANGTTYGAAVGNSSNGSDNGVALGYSADGNTGGASVGRSSNASSYGAALGYAASVNSHGFAKVIGAYSKAQRYGELAITGDHQSTCKNAWGQVQWSGSTANGTQTELYLHGTASYRCTVLASSAIHFVLRIAAREDATGDCKMVKIEGGIKRDGSNNTTLVGDIATTTICQDSGAAAWSVTAVADDSNEALVPKVTGEASHTIKWQIVGELIDVRQ